MAHTIVWFDIPVANLTRACNFYSRVLDKDLQITHAGEFTMVVFPHADEDVAGCLYEDKNFVANTSGMLLYFDVNKRIKEAVAQAVAAGGKIDTDVMPIGPYGYRAVLLDSEGNKIALHAQSLD